MVLSLGNTIIMPRGLYIQLVQGRNKTPFSVGYAYLRECVPVTSKLNYIFVFTFKNNKYQYVSAMNTILSCFFG